MFVAFFGCFQISFVVGEISFSKGEESFGFGDLVFSFFELLGFFGDFQFHCIDFLCFGCDFSFEFTLCSIFLVGEVFDILSEVILNINHKLHDVLDCVLVRELSGRETHQGVDESGLNTVSEFFLGFCQSVFNSFNLNE